MKHNMNGIISGQSGNFELKTIILNLNYEN